MIPSITQSRMELYRIYVSDKELEESWKSRSSFDYRGKDKKGQELKQTLIRYLNSKNLRKDMDGMAELTDKDIRNIEQGISNYHYARKFNLNSRIYKVLWGYQIAKMGDLAGIPCFSESNTGKLLLELLKLLLVRSWNRRSSGSF
ncbi:MAG: hypothetical protein R2764_23325 [Bacteroidales bacterium]